jgi:tetraacyldisaccharide 4'-kinase
MPRRGPFAALLQDMLVRHWWRPRPSLLAWLLRPLALLYGWLLRWQRRWTGPVAATPVPVVVVGNLVVGGAGKTPIVIALVQALQRMGWRPGVISRGFGREGDAVAEVASDSLASHVGDEPLLIHRRTGAPVWVGRKRLQAARALCHAHPDVDVLVSDDGLQHRALGRAAEWLVFDERGVGNGLLLPAGPLREPLPARLPAASRVLYSASHPSTPLAGTAIPRRIGSVLPLAAWWQGDEARSISLDQLQGRALLAVAGTAAPEKFFAMLEAAGLHITRCAQPDHAGYATLPWPPGTADVLTTEKDAVKLQPQAAGATRVWVARLDLALPAELLRDLDAVLRRAATGTPS